MLQTLQLNTFSITVVVVIVTAAAAVVVDIVVALLACLQYVKFTWQK